MSSDEEWEVVNHKQRKDAKSQKRKESQQQRKQREQQEKEAEEQRRKELQDTFMQQYVLAKPLETETSSIYDSFKSKDRSGNNDMVMSGSDDEKPQKTKKPKKPKAKKPSVKNVAAQIDNTQLKEQLNQFSERFPDKFDIQLKSLAEQLEIVFNTADPKKEKDKTWQEQLNVPYSYVEATTITTITEWLRKTPEDALSVYFWFLLTTLVKVSSDASTSGYGLKLMIQILARHFPSSIMKNVTNMKNSYTSNSQSPTSLSVVRNNVAPVIMWTHAQFLEKQLSNALNLWAQFWIGTLGDHKPTEEIKTSALEFVDMILESAKSRHITFDETTAIIVYERMLIAKFSENKKFPEKFSELITKLTDLSFLLGKNAPKKLMVMLMGHAADSNKELREEVLQLLVKLLSQHAKFFDYWNDIYTDNIAQSNNLMLYITLNWDNLDNSFPAEAMLQATQNFTKINKELTADKKSKKSKLTKEEIDEINMVSVTCKALRKKLEGVAMTKQATSLAIVVVPVVSAVMAGAAYTALKCCEMEWCYNISTLRQMFQC